MKRACPSGPCAKKFGSGVLPVEDHGFVQPSSWADEYKRIFKLFEKVGSVMWLVRIMRYVFRIFFLALGLVGIAGIVWGIYALSFSISALRVEGKVIANQLQTDLDGDSYYYPEVEFVTPDGRSHRFVGDNGTAPPSFKVGERVTIVYKKNDPDSAKIGTFFEFFFGPLLLCGLGFGWLIAIYGISALEKCWRTIRGLRPAR